MEKDAILVQQTLSGDNDAFNHLIRKYQGEVFAISLSVVKNPEDAKDISSRSVSASVCQPATTQASR